VTGEHPARPGRPRLVVDPGVYVSAAISGTGAPAHLLETAIEGRVVLLVSPLLLAELRDVLARDKFRRWLSLQDAAVFVDAVTLLADPVEDPPEETWTRVCRDPDDDYLVALAEATGATLLVSGDQDLLSVRRPGLDVRSPRDAIDAILYAHPWGPALIPAEAEAAWRQAAATGHSNVLETTAVFMTIVRDSYAVDLLAHVVTPESLSGSVANLEKVRDLVSERGMASGVDYPGNDIAYVKLPPDPGETVRATGDVLLEGAVIVTLQRRPELADTLGLGGWRVHGIGDYLRPEDLPTRGP
jgi:putative PIN family toxin of toxin-antitoxin system